MEMDFGRGIKNKSRSLAALAPLKKSIVNVKSENNFLPHALIIAFARITKDRNYKSFRDGRKLGPAVRQLLESTGINLDLGGGIRELTQFQEYYLITEFLFFFRFRV